ncbi:MAG TPA: L-seryl-tRNA(Sec) selenium transferase, partial [Pyrinomonadaceae bacterium]|nr:L-seryl-tRNA(Sec) selenium transferase [Pyrinomonadaceae bacterium]
MVAKGTRSRTLLRNLPSVDELLRTAAGRRYSAGLGESAAAGAARVVIDQLRGAIVDGALDDTTREQFVERAEQALLHDLQAEAHAGVRRVINATGVVIHTNLGRAPLSEQAREALIDVAGYCTLEYDLETGKRGSRGGKAERLIAELTGAEDALIVNNGAAAAFFVLSVFASGGEVIVSRGELVEIGGDFRIPDVLERSGATLREVGTTNRTKLADYEKAISESTRMVLRVHPSNYRIVGFTTTPAREVVATLANKSGVLFYEDLGSGALIDLSIAGIVDEPIVADALATGVDLVSFSGDKLLGGPQAGIIAGRKELIDQLRKHPLYRVLRADKLGCAALEATLLSYRRDTASRDVPVLRQIIATAAEIGERSARLIKQVGPLAKLKVEIVDGVSAVGGGAAPTARLSTRLISLSHENRSAEHLERALRMGEGPVVARIERG